MKKIKKPLKSRRTTPEQKRNETNARCELMSERLMFIIVLANRRRRGSGRTEGKEGYTTDD